jgi:hypothetical protein
MGDRNGTGNATKTDLLAPEKAWASLWRGWAGAA